MDVPEPVSEEETRLIFFKILEQSIRDYINLESSESINDKYLYSTAKGLLLDKEYIIEWGDLRIGLYEILNYLQIEEDYFVRKVQDTKKKQLILKEKKNRNRKEK